MNYGIHEIFVISKNKIGGFVICIMPEMCESCSRVQTSESKMASLDVNTLSLGHGNIIVYKRQNNESVQDMYMRFAYRLKGKFRANIIIDGEASLSAPFCKELITLIENGNSVFNPYCINITRTGQGTFSIDVNARFWAGECCCAE
jgi:hypothetical protein